MGQQRRATGRRGRAHGVALKPVAPSSALRMAAGRGAACPRAPLRKSSRLTAEHLEQVQPLPNAMQPGFSQGKQVLGR